MLDIDKLLGLSCVIDCYDFFLRVRVQILKLSLLLDGFDFTRFFDVILQRNSLTSRFDLAVFSIVRAGRRHPLLTIVGSTI